MRTAKTVKLRTCQCRNVTQKCALPVVSGRALCRFCMLFCEKPTFNDGGFSHDNIKSEVMFGDGF